VDNIAWKRRGIMVSPRVAGNTNKVREEWGKYKSVNGLYKSFVMVEGGTI